MVDDMIVFVFGNVSVLRNFRGILIFSDQSLVFCFPCA